MNALFNIVCGVIATFLSAIAVYVWNAFVCIPFWEYPVAFVSTAITCLLFGMSVGLLLGRNIKTHDNSKKSHDETDIKARLQSLTNDEAEAVLLLYSKGKIDVDGNDSALESLSSKGIAESFSCMNIEKTTYELKDSYRKKLDNSPRLRRLLKR